VSTVDKALKLLNFFTVNRPEVGLSDLARLAGYDKATTRRLLVSLAAYGFVEQDGRTRAYRLGGGASRLARIREAQFPLTQTAIPIMKELARDTGETVHLSEFSAGSLVTLHVELSPRAHRVNVDVGDVLPLHSTASGIAYLAFCGDDADDLVDRRRMTAYTSQTITDFGALGDAITAAARRGYAIGDQGFEEGVLGIAAPILGANGQAIGTLAVASPLQRVDRGTKSRHGAAVTAAANAISARLNGEPMAAA
jgi:DNA-binding IclR family transcriptional regulator